VKKPRALRKTEVAAKPSTLVSVTRSYVYKLSDQYYGGKQFESHDFFCSQTVECRAENAEEASAKVYAFCKKEVLKSVAEWKEENRPLTSGEVRERKEVLQQQIRPQTMQADPTPGRIV
jgi:gas vesicle protein